MNHFYKNFIYNNMVIHRYDYARLNQLDPSNYIDDIIRWLVDVVRKAVNYACDLRNMDLSIVKYQRWHDAAYDFYSPITQKYLYFNRPMLCARFGYAIEEYVNRYVESHQYPHQDVFLIDTQCRMGKTIPDLVIRQLKIDPKTGQFYNIDVAWLDITSDGSVGHIYKKKGSGWRTKDIVIELTYPSLEIKDLLL